MAADSKTTTRTSDRNRVVYRLTGDQVFRMLESGIIPDDVDVELWDGVLYRMTKHEPHNFTVGVTAEALRRVTPAGYHVREEKSARSGAHSLPEPDVCVARGHWRDYQTQPPTLADIALVVEVCAGTGHADRVAKPPRYAGAGIPVYGLIDLDRRRVEVHSAPEGSGKSARYAKVEEYEAGQEFPVVIDRHEAAPVAVSDVLPAERRGQGPP